MNHDRHSIPLGFIEKVDDSVNLLEFSSSEKVFFTNGTAIYADGGLLAIWP